MGSVGLSRAAEGERRRAGPVAIRPAREVP